MLHLSRVAAAAGARLRLACCAAGLLGACGGGHAPPPVAAPPPAPQSLAALQITTLSNRADLISDGDALVELVLPPGATTTGLGVSVEGRDVSDAFALRADGRITGVVSGLAVGPNTITAQTADAARASLVVTNAPRGGPMFSGPQLQPYFCATPVPQGATATTPATNASGLSGAAVDVQCNIPSETRLYYRTTRVACSPDLPDPSPDVAYDSSAPATTAPPPANACFRPYDPAAAPPADLAMTTTDTGLTVPYVVRIERGTMNRGIYDIAVLFDPTQPWTATAPQPQWNGKVFYQFGAGIGQTRRQVRPDARLAWSVLGSRLARGTMVAASSMTDSATNANRIVMVETAMMMKEHIVDTYGPIRFTVGAGCSGGSVNADLTSSLAPGLLDGLTIGCTFPDSETTSIEPEDCSLLVEAYQKPEWTALMTRAHYSQAQINARKTAINGHLDQSGCHAWYNGASSSGRTGMYVGRKVVNQTTGAIAEVGGPVNNCELPQALVWDPVTNPTGTRCGLADWSAPIWGRTADGSRVLSTHDNEGVQYGLQALLAGAITGEEFVTLNEIVGGADGEGLPQAARTRADPSALDLAYRASLVLDGRRLANLPVIDLRGWDDSSLIVQPGLAAPTTTPVHHLWRSYSIRDRLDRDFGDHDNQVIWRFGRGGLLSAPLSLDAIATIDTWLTNLKADTSDAPLAQKVRLAKPAGAVDLCLLSTDVRQSTKVYDMAVCDADPFLKPSSSPRRVAGGPLAENVLKCQLRPLDSAEYGGRLDTAQVARLQAVFRDGVCDWSRPGVGQQPAGASLSFATGPGGRPMPTVPVSRPTRPDDPAPCPGHRAMDRAPGDCSWMQPAGRDGRQPGS